MAVLFDTLKLADRLETAGMPPRQARDTAAALADTLGGTVATTADVETSDLRLRTGIAELRAEVRGWLITQAFAIVGANAAIAAVAAALSRLLH